MWKGKDDIKYKTEEDIKRLEASANREPSQGILDHERKRKLEVPYLPPTFFPYRRYSFSRTVPVHMFPIPNTIFPVPTNFSRRYRTVPTHFPVPPHFPVPHNTFLPYRTHFSVPYTFFPYRTVFPYRTGTVFPYSTHFSRTLHIFSVSYTFFPYPTHFSHRYRIHFSRTVPRYTFSPYRTHFTRRYRYRTYLIKQLIGSEFFLLGSVFITRLCI